MKILFIFFALILAISCGNKSVYVKPDFLYKGKVNSSQVDSLHIFIKELAGIYNLDVFEKNREDMQFLTHGENAFYLSLYKNNHDAPVMWISNVGSGTVLTFGFSSNEYFSLEDVRSLFDKVKIHLENNMSIYLQEVE